MKKLINSIENIKPLLYAEGVYSFKKIQKNNKSDRNIYIPNNKLKKIQKMISIKLEEDFINEINRMKYQNAYLKNKSIVTNAKVHVAKKYLIKLDIKDFFDSITFARIYGKMNKKYDKETALKISQISCYRKNGKHIALAQGSPSSPIISNLISQHIDIFIFKFLRDNVVNQEKVFYTRYSDDISISTNDYNNFKNLKNKITSENFLSEFKNKTKFEINKDKTKVFSNGKKLVTGIVINEKLNISKKYRNELRNYLRISSWNL